MSIEMPTGLAPPHRFSILREFTAPLDWMSLGFGAGKLRRAPKGDGRPVVLVPGYKSSHRAMKPLARFLRSKNYDVRHWGLGTNHGSVDTYVEALGKSIVDRGSAPVTLIGWSLGGVISREIARLNAPHVREIITMGTPLIGGPKYTIAAHRYARSQSLDLDKFEHEVHRRNSIGLTQPITAFYSKTDGIVGWEAAIDIYNPHARNIEVQRTHLGIGINVDVWCEIAETLAATNA